MKQQSEDLALVDTPSPGTIARDPAAVAIVKLMESPDALKNVEALERLSDLYLKLQASDAEKQFAVAFNALQAEMPAIRAMSVVNNSVDKGGGVRYKFAPYEDIMQQVRPLLLKYGFTVSFSSDVTDGRVTQHCTLQHIAGHKRTNSFAARVSKPPGASEAQGDGATSTYAKRFALCDCLNIVIEKDNDARALGDVISPEQALYLRERVKETGSDEARFLKLAQAERYEDITEDKYDLLVIALGKKERPKG